MSDINQGIELFNDADYFSAHDFFEDLWCEAPRDERFFYQGLVHVSVASFHLISGNLKGALSQYSKSLIKLERYKPGYANINIEDLTASVEIIVAELSEGSNNSLESLVKLLPKIKKLK